jgi:hypothetical protein
VEKRKFLAPPGLELWLLNNSKINLIYEFPFIGLNEAGGCEREPSA